MSTRAADDRRFLSAGPIKFAGLILSLLVFLFSIRALAGPADEDERFLDGLRGRRLFRLAETIAASNWPSDISMQIARCC